MEEESRAVVRRSLNHRLLRNSFTLLIIAAMLTFCPRIYSSPAQSRVEKPSAFAGSCDNIDSYSSPLVQASQVDKGP